MKEKTRKEKEREARETAIIDAAEKLFYEYGFNNVSMDKIASEAEFTKRTLYKYFENKEDLYFAVAFRLFRQLAMYCGNAINKGKTGFDKIRLSFTAYYNFHKDYPKALRIMNTVSIVKKRGSKRENEWMELDARMFSQIAEVIELGKSDGSIRKDIDSQETSFVIAFITTGFFNQLAETGHTFTKHFNLSEEKFSMAAINLLLDSLRPEKI